MVKIDGTIDRSTADFYLNDDTSPCVSNKRGRSRRRVTKLLCYFDNNNLRAVPVLRTWLDNSYRASAEQRMKKKYKQDRKELILIRRSFIRFVVVVKRQEGP